MFNKKTRRNFRQRKDNSSEEEEEQKSNGDGEEKKKAAVLVNKPLHVSQSRGISCSSKREATSPKPVSSGEEDGETLEVTEDLEERKKARIKRKDEKNNPMLSFSDDKEANEATFKLKKTSDKAILFQVPRKEVSRATNTHKSGTVAGSVPLSASLRQDDDGQSSPCALHHNDHSDSDDRDDDDDDDDDDEDDNNSDNFKGDVPSPSTSSASDSSRSAIKPEVIPTDEEIQAARRKRSAFRAKKEFIPLGRDGNSSAGSTPGHYSRAEDEDEVEDDDEPDNHERRIEFAPRFKSIRERIAQALGESDDSVSGSDEEEKELWEATQIGKGVKRHPGEQSPSGSESSSYSYSSSSSRLDKHNQKKRSAGVRIPKSFPPVNVSMIKKRITEKLDSLKEVHRARQAEQRKIEFDVDSAKTSAETLEESSSESQLKFYRAMTLYVHNLVECLREKVVEINSLELELHALLSEGLEVLLAQRRQRTKEHADRLQQLSYATDEQKGNSANGTETQVEADTSVKAEEDFKIPEDTEFSAEEDEQLRKKKDDILLRAQEVFSDVQDEYSDVKKILSHFEQWRGSYSDSYHSAYISLCLPKLLNPIIRHQLLVWNPLKDTSEDFETLPWYAALETFCHGHGHEELEHTDRQTLSNVIEKTVLPKMTAYVELVWDPQSSRQSASLSDVCHKLREDYSIFEGEQSKPVKAFVEAVIRRLRSCVDEDVFIPLYPKKFLEDQSTPQCRFRDQQFWTATKLLGNMGKWDLLLPESVLKELILDRLLNRYLMITLCSQPLHSNTVCACRKIADSLPLSWFKGHTVCLPQLQNFRNLIVQKIHSICKQQPPEDPNTRSAVVELLQILSTVRCNDSIVAIAEKYHYEDVVYAQQLLNQETE